MTTLLTILITGFVVTEIYAHAYEEMDKAWRKECRRLQKEIDDLDIRKKERSLKEMTDICLNS